MPDEGDKLLSMQRIGGVCALVAGVTFIVGIVLFATALSDYTSGDPSPAESVEFLVDHEALMYAWNIIIFVVFGIALVPVVLAIHDRSQPGWPLNRLAAAFGLIWAGLVIAAGMIANVGWQTVTDVADEDLQRAVTLWEAIDSIQNGIGGGNEIAGGLWVLLASASCLHSESLPRLLCYLGIVSGAAGLITVIPGLEPVGAVFGLGLIIWFVWAGFTLSRPTEQTVPIPRP
jgi:hypothetical protein